MKRTTGRLRRYSGLLLRHRRSCCIPRTARRLHLTAGGGRSKRNTDDARLGNPAPGGKGAPRGAPDSFLANPLGAQAQADDILEASIDEDPTRSGKLRLSRALAALAQDPLFKRVLDTAQRDSFFTDTGKRRRGQSSRFGGRGPRQGAQRGAG